MGRVRNTKLEQQQELEDNLSALRQQLADKESEFLNFEIRDHLDSVRDLVSMLTRRIELLENNVTNIKIINAKKDQNNSTTNSIIFSLITGVVAISAIYYKFRH